MKTENLIDMLSTNVELVDRLLVPRRLFAAVALGFVALLPMSA